MGRGSAVDKRTRLDRLLGLLKSGHLHTAVSLASELEVSSRTLMRDLNDLKDQGYPIETEQGRGGGVRLYPRWGIGRLALNYREVIDLLLALSVLEKMPPSLLLGNLKSVRHKVFASFPDSQRPAIQQLRDRILIGEMASATALQSFDGHMQSGQSSLLLEAFFDCKRADMSYRRGDGTQSSRQIEIHYLFLNWPVWYLIAWDYLRNAPRTFRVDRIQDIGLTNHGFRVRPLAEFSEELSRFSQPL